jgi:hypothetical protein
MTADQLVRDRLEHLASTVRTTPPPLQVIIAQADTAATSGRSPARRIGGSRRAERRPFTVRRPALWIGSVAAASLLTVGLVAINQRDGERSPGAVVSPGAVASSEPTTTAPPSTTVARPVEITRSLDGLGWPPRLLLDESWEVVTVDERSFNEGYITFRRDDVVVFVGWYRGEQGPENGTAGSDQVGTALLLGEPAAVFSSPLAYSSAEITALIEDGALAPEGVLADFAPDASSVSPPDASTLPEEAASEPDLVGGPMLDEALAGAVTDGLIEPVPSSGPSAVLNWDGSSISVSVLAGGPGAYDVEHFVAVVESLGHVDPASWEAALPERVVTPALRQQVLDDMLAGVPLPDGFDVTQVGAELIRDRANLAGLTQQQVACAWLNRFFEDDGDGERAAEALQALATMPDWPVTEEVADFVAEQPDGVIYAGDGMGPLTINDDGTITYDATGEILDGYFAAQHCNGTAVG